MENRTFSAFYGHDSSVLVRVAINTQGFVTPLDGLKLPNGVYSLLGDHDQVIGSFEVRDGTIGIAHADWSQAMAAKPKPQPTILELRINLEFSDLATQTMNGISLLEHMTTVILDGKTCPHCGGTHSPEEMGSTRTALVAEVVKELEVCRQHDLSSYLVGLLADSDAAIQAEGFKNREQVSQTMTRFNALLAWQIANTTKSSDETTNITPPPASTSTEEGANSPA